MKIIITQGDWRTKPLTIKNRTTQTLSNGKVIPTGLAMYRIASKIK